MSMVLNKELLDKFVVDNMLSEEDLELDIDALEWQSMASSLSQPKEAPFKDLNDNDNEWMNVNVSRLDDGDNDESQMCQTHSKIQAGSEYDASSPSCPSLTPPDTPPSSDSDGSASYTPPDWSDVNVNMNVVNDYSFNSMNDASSNTNSIYYLTGAGSHINNLNHSIEAQTHLQHNLNHNPNHNPNHNHNPQIAFSPTLLPSLLNTNMNAHQTPTSLHPLLVSHSQLSEHNISRSNRKVAPISPAISPKLPTIINSNMNDHIKTVPTQQQTSQMKREARKLRNRMASMESRRKKQEQLNCMSTQMNALVKENADLRVDNIRLKCKINDLENENEMLKRCISQSQMDYDKNMIGARGQGKASLNGKKTALSLLAVLFMLGLNLAPFTGINIASQDNTLIDKSNINMKVDASIKHGVISRSLLWANESKFTNRNIDSFQSDIKLKLGYPENALNKSSMTSAQHNCVHTYINQTESLRLESELRGWVLRVENEKKEIVKQKKRMLRNKTQSLKDRLNKAVPLPRLKSWMENELGEENKVNAIGNGMQVFNRVNGNYAKHTITYEDLLSAIQRRDDTFYFVSFSASDHLLLPAIVNNASMIRPRFSIIMPSMNTYNETSPSGTNVTHHEIAMMQIDCDVINAKMVHVKNVITNENANQGKHTGMNGSVDAIGNKNGIVNVTRKSTNHRVIQKNKQNETRSKIGLLKS